MEKKELRKAIDELEIFFISDMWYALKNEWKSKTDMVPYLDEHFEIFRNKVLNLNDEKDSSHETSKFDKNLGLACIDPDDDADIACDCHMFVGGSGEPCPDCKLNGCAYCKPKTNDEKDSNPVVT